MNNRFWTLIAFLVAAKADSRRNAMFTANPRQPRQRANGHDRPRWGKSHRECRRSSDGAKHRFVLDGDCATKEWRILRADGSETVFTREGTEVTAEGQASRQNENRSRRCLTVVWIRSPRARRLRSLRYGKDGILDHQPGQRKGV
jgi:hypothetical protein